MFCLGLGFHTFRCCPVPGVRSNPYWQRSCPCQQYIHHGKSGGRTDRERMDRERENQTLRNHSNQNNPCNKSIYVQHWAEHIDQGTSSTSAVDKEGRNPPPLTDQVYEGYWEHATSTYTMQSRDINHFTATTSRIYSVLEQKNTTSPIIQLLNIKYQIIRKTKCI